MANLEEATDTELDRIKELVDATFKTQTGKRLPEELLIDTLGNVS